MNMRRRRSALVEKAQHRASCPASRWSACRFHRQPACGARCSPPAGRRARPSSPVLLHVIGDVSAEVQRELGDLVLEAHESSREWHRLYRRLRACTPAASARCNASSRGRWPVGSGTAASAAIDCLVQAQVGGGRRDFAAHAPAPCRACRRHRPESRADRP